jgi:hypothetical protein
MSKYQVVAKASKEAVCPSCGAVCLCFIATVSSTGELDWKTEEEARADRSKVCTLQVSFRRCRILSFQLLCSTVGHVHIMFKRTGEPSAGRLLLKFYHRMFQGILEMYTRERTLF